VWGSKFVPYSRIYGQLDLVQKRRIASPSAGEAIQESSVVVVAGTVRVVELLLVEGDNLTCRGLHVEHLTNRVSCSEKESVVLEDDGVPAVSREVSYVSQDDRLAKSGRVGKSLDGVLDPLVVSDALVFEDLDGLLSEGDLQCGSVESHIILRKFKVGTSRLLVL